MDVRRFPTEPRIGESENSRARHGPVAPSRARGLGRVSLLTFLCTSKESKSRKARKLVHAATDQLTGNVSYVQSAKACAFRNRSAHRERHLRAKRQRASSHCGNRTARVMQTGKEPLRPVASRRTETSHHRLPGFLPTGRPVPRGCACCANRTASLSAAPATSSRSFT